MTTDAAAPPSRSFIDMLAPAFERAREGSRDAWKQGKAQVAEKSRQALDYGKTQAKELGGKAVAMPVAGVKGIFINLWPENAIGVYTWAVIVFYFYSWNVGFVAEVFAAHIVLAFIGFFCYLRADGFSRDNIRETAALFLAMLGIDYVLLTGTFNIPLLAIAFLLLSFRKGGVTEDIKNTAKVLAVIGILIFAYTRYQERLMNWSSGAGLLAFVALYVVNKTFTFPFFWHAILFLPERTRVARLFTWVVVLILVVANLGVIFPSAEQAYNSQLSGAVSAEQKAVWPMLVAKSVNNLRSGVGGFLSLRWLPGQIDKAHASFEPLFGFGEANKAQPKLGLELQQPGMPESFDMGIVDSATPGVVMSVPNRLPDKFGGTVSVVDIDCITKSNDVEVSGTLIEPVLESDLDFGNYITIGQGSSSTAKCEFNGLAGDSYASEFTVSYNMKSEAKLETMFMSSGKIDALRSGQEIPGKEDKVPPAFADYDNGPVSVTWGPVELTKTPVNVNIFDLSTSGLFTAAKIDRSKAGTELSREEARRNRFTSLCRATSGGTKPRNVGENLVCDCPSGKQWVEGKGCLVPQLGFIEVYVASRGKGEGWNGEIAAINSLELTVPEGIVLDTYDENAKTGDKNCFFESSGPNSYLLKEKVLNVDKAVGSKIEKVPRHIGEGLKLSCKMKLKGDVTDSLLRGTDRIGALFKVKMDYDFATKITSNFDVKPGVDVKNA